MFSLLEDGCTDRFLKFLEEVIGSFFVLAWRIALESCHC